MCVVVEPAADGWVIKRWWSIEECSWGDGGWSNSSAKRGESHKEAGSVGRWGSNDGCICTDKGFGGTWDNSYCTTGLHDELLNLWWSNLNVSSCLLNGSLLWSSLTLRCPLPHLPAYPFYPLFRKRAHPFSLTTNKTSITSCFLWILIFTFLHCLFMIWFSSLLFLPSSLPLFYVLNDLSFFFALLLSFRLLVMFFDCVAVCRQTMFFSN